MNTPTLEELLKLADDLREACKSTKSAFPESEPPKGLPMGIALGLAGANIPMPPQPREKPHLSTALSERDYAQLKKSLDGAAASLGYPLGVSDELVQQFGNRHGMVSKFKAQPRPSIPASLSAPKPKFKKPRHPNARKRR